jgi:hypothetical protein
MKFNPSKHFSDEEVFVENSTYKSSVNLKRRVLKLRKHKCEKCGNIHWLNK